MRVSKILIGASLAILVLLAGCQSGPPLKHALEENDRSPPGGREVVVFVPQGEIRARVVPATGGFAFGLIGAIVDTSVNQARAKKEEATIGPIRDGLTGYNFDQKALASAKQTSEKLPWLGVKKVSFSKDISDESLVKSLDQSESPQVAFVAYDYALSADFSSVILTVRVSVMPKSAPAGQARGDRLKLEGAAYAQVFKCPIALSNPTDMDANARRWAANSSALTRQALDEGLMRTQRMIERSIAMTPTEVANMPHGDATQVGAYKGRVFDHDEQGTLILDLAGAWLYVENAPIG
jgi:hypothetical protein